MLPTTASSTQEKASAHERKRRAHLKSRRGCLACKRRHHKCDEVHPQCGGCRRAQTECSFDGPKITSPHTTQQSTPSQTWHTEAHSSLDVELMAEIFFDNTAIGAGAIHDQVRLALSKPYLLHEMLAVSALRLFSQAKWRHELLERAAYHQGEASSLARPHVVSVEGDHPLAMLFFASYAAKAGLAEAALNSSERDDPVEKMIQVFGLTRGIRSVLSPSWDYLKGTWAWPLMQIGINARKDLEPHEQAIPGYSMLRSSAFGVEGKEARQACVQAVEHTCRSISLLQQKSDATLCAVTLSVWPLDIQPDFFVLLGQRKPVALVVFAYYAALLSYASQLWWVQEWPAVLIRFVDGLLGEEWAEFLRWPKEVVLGQAGATDSADGVS